MNLDRAVNYVILTLFLIEATLKNIATGFSTPGIGYIWDPWNRLDFFVVL